MYANYLKSLKDIYDSQLVLEEIVFVLGNPSCDMDSCLSSYFLSIGKNIKENVISIDKSTNTPIYNKNSKIIYLPVLNTKRGTLHHRLDVKYVFDLFNVEEKDFWYISDEIFDENKVFEYHKNNNIKTEIILVDHNKLIEEQKYLSKYVIEIYDHHSDKLGDFPNLNSLTLKYPLGSCTSLILFDYFFNEFPNCLLSPLLALTAIIVDTENFKETFYKNRWVDFDKIVFDKIISEIKEKDKKDISLYFKEIINVKYNVEKNLDLGVDILLLKDQKYFNWKGLKIIWSALQVDYNKILDRFGLNEIITQMYSYYINKTKEEVMTQYFITNSSIDDKVRLFTIFNPIDIPIDIKELKNSLSFTLKDGFISIDKENIVNLKLKGVIYYIKLDRVYTRKTIEPIFKELFTSLISVNDLIE